MFFAAAAGVLTAVALVSAAGLARGPENNHAPAKPAPKPAAQPAAKPATNHGAEPAKGPKSPAKAEEPPKAGEAKVGAKSAPAAERKIDAEGEPVAERPSKPKIGAVDGGITAEKGLALLAEGNARWVANQAENPAGEPSRRAKVAEDGQKPFVTVLTCADSRLPVERIFDRGVGEVFVVRVAGNIAGVSETGTVEYGLGHLKTPLLVVMGHSKCGAVAAAASGAEVHGAVGKILGTIRPAIERAKRNNPGADEKALVAAAVKENVWQTIFDLLKQSDEVRGMVERGEVKVVGAVCDVSTGKVDILGEHPWQSELMDVLASRKAGGAHHAAVEPTAAGAKAVQADEDHHDPH
jgi:carbonic anhydrase